MSSKVVILGLSSVLPHPYSAGHRVLTQNEADTLNRAFVHSASKGLHRTISAAREGGCDEETVRRKAGEFVLLHVEEFREGPERLRAIEFEARRIALLAIESREYQAGRMIKEMAREELEAALAKMAKSAEVVEEATRRVDTFRSLARSAGVDQKGIEELLS